MAMYPCKKVGMDFFETAPYCFLAEETIAASPEQIFAVFEDAHAWTIWAKPIQEVEWTSPKPFRLGTTRTVSMTGGLKGYEEFIAWEPGKRMAFCFVGCSHDTLEAFAEDYRVTDLGDGRCRVQWLMAMAPKGAAKFSLGLIKPLMAWYNRKMFRDFRKYVESQANTVT